MIDQKNKDANILNLRIPCPFFSFHPLPLLESFVLPFLLFSCKSSVISQELNAALLLHLKEQTNGALKPNRKKTTCNVMLITLGKCFIKQMIVRGLHKDLIATKCQL